MEKQLEIALSELIQKTLQGVDTAKDFLTAEIPDVVKQLLMWHGTFQFIEFLISIVLFIIGVVMARNLLINKDEIKWGEYDWTIQMTNGLVKASVSCVFIFISLFLLNFTWLQIWIAPKVWLIEYMKNLVK